MRLRIIGLLLALMVAACSRPPVGESPSTSVHYSCDASTAPSMGETARAVAACLSPDASPQEAAELLLRWQRIDNRHWGGAIAADLLPGGEAELILTYHADMTEVIWNPQGKIAVLQASTNGWQVAFESPAPGPGTGDGSQTLAGNWSFHPAAVGDVTGDGLDDLLVEQQWSNAHYGYESYTKLFTADAAESDPLRILYLEEGSDTIPQYAIVNQTVQSVIPLNGMEAITHTYGLDGNEFKMTAESINPAAAQLSATTADGAGWYAYDRTCGSLCTQMFGLYRLQDGQLTHYDVPGRITTLEVLRDGDLYVGSSEGIFRMDQGALVKVTTEEYEPVNLQTGVWTPLDMTLTGDGDLWVAGQMRLLHFSRTLSTVHELIAFEVTAAPDESVWVLGWDGIADSGCCYYHVQENEVTAYKFADSLPVSAELEREIRAMRQ